MSAAPKGKLGTKGAKQIAEENVATLVFYRNMAGIALTLSIVGSLIFSTTTKFEIFMITFCGLLLLAAYQFMAFMSKAQYSESGALMDAGNDLNMIGGIAENVKDLIILTSITMILALISSYFWLLLLFAPFRAGWMLWGTLIKPWLAQHNEKEEPETDEKKKKKMERRLKRMQR